MIFSILKFIKLQFDKCKLKPRISDDPTTPIEVIIHDYNRVHL